MLDKIKIIQYDDKYKKQIIEFLIKITIDEFGFDDWREYFENKSFDPYKIDGSIFFIALDSANTIIGTCGGLKMSEEIIKLNSFYLDKNYRGIGLGKKLYNLFLEYVNKKKYKEIILCTYKEYDVAIKFYEKRDFRLYETGDYGQLWYKKEL